MKKQRIFDACDVAIICGLALLLVISLFAVFYPIIYSDPAPAPAAVEAAAPAYTLNIVRL